MEISSPTPLGALLLRSRKRAELTQEALAERAGVSVNTISNLEAGRGHLPRQATLDLLADALAGTLPPHERDPFRAAVREAAHASRALRRPTASPATAAPVAAPTTHAPPAGILTFLVCAAIPSPSPEMEAAQNLRAVLPQLALPLQQVVPRHGGRLVNPPDGPDGAVCVFLRPGDAVMAACAIQQALHDRALPACLALHTGRAEPGAGDYAGPSRRRAARLVRSGHSGQLLLTMSVRDLIQGSLPEGVRLAGAGRQALSAVERPQPLFQLAPVLQPGTFPPLRAPVWPPNNLPVQLTSLVGRERELAAVEELLGQAPLVTLVGTGGAGKTRLALATAAELLEGYQHGAWLVELAALAGAPLVPQAVAAALGLREEPGRSILETLAVHLQDKRVMLVLDNCEHLVTACAELAAALLRRCPHLQILATSRERLGIGGEASYRVPSLALPPPDERPTKAVGEYEGVRLFVERARASRPDFALSEENASLVARICTRLHGIPLALELAAARVGGLPLGEIAERLERSLGVLTEGPRDAPSRHRTLRAALDWSYDLLGEPERALLRRASVFAGGWALEAAEAVCGGADLVGWPVAGLLAGLVGKSLALLQEGDAAGRYALLEPVRQYSWERLEASGEATVVRDRHLAWCVSLAEEAALRLTGSEQGRWLERLETEHDNLRAALAWAQESGAAEGGLRLASALFRFWVMRGYLSEGRRWLEVSLTCGSSGSAALRAHALNGSGILAFAQGDYEQAVRLLGAALALRRGLGDNGGVAATLLSLGNVASFQADHERAAALYQEALAHYRGLGDRWGIANALGNLGNVAADQGEYTQAAALFQEALALDRDLGNTHGVAASLTGLGNVTSDQGDHARAAGLYQEALALHRDLEDRRGIANSLSNLARAASGQGEYDRATALYEEALALRRDLGDKQGVASSLNGLGIVALEQGEYGRAATLHQEALLLSRDIGAQDLAEDILEALARGAGAQGQARRAAQLGGIAEALRETLGGPLTPSERVGHDRMVQALRAALGEAGFAAAWAEGRALPLEQAVDIALAGEQGCAE